jgi:hypothetical protein
MNAKSSGSGGVHPHDGIWDPGKYVRRFVAILRTPALGSSTAFRRTPTVGSVAAVLVLLVLVALGVRRQLDRRDR